MMDTISGLSGFVVGFGTILLVFLYQRKKGKKERRFDERYETVHAKARSISWGVTLIAIVLMWIGVIIYEGPKLAFFLFTILYLITISSYGIAAAIFNKKS